MTMCFDELDYLVHYADWLYIRINIVVGKVVYLKNLKCMLSVAFFEVCKFVGFSKVHNKGIEL